jgi:adenine-specific DNA-methyltransferase|tara:strand:- start:2708 stop:3697 length:990 start_codon:yes stop_codon:yes gene_type:complete
MSFEISNRRYIGSKAALSEWIIGAIPKKFNSGVFFDAFAGTGALANAASGVFSKVVINDLLFSNEAIYRGFFGSGKYDLDKVSRLATAATKLAKKENYFSLNFGGKYFTPEDARLIGAIRLAIDFEFPDSKDRNRHIALASLIYSADRSAITVGHYEAFLRSGKSRPFQFDLISPKKISASIYRQDANTLARKISADVAYLDPPYNSRQYSRFYHVLETLTKWDDPELFGVALKPTPENISDYCKTAAPASLRDLVENLDAKFVLISYNNTYKSKSSSSQNKISLEEIEDIARSKGRTKILEMPHKHFNAGNTSFDNHREFLFTIEVKK